jgi:hypothetical protein
MDGNLKTLVPTRNKTDESKRKGVGLGGKVLPDKKLA